MILPYGIYLPNNMKRYLIVVEYKGTNYCGWQRQNNALSVQQALADAFYVLTKEKATMHGSGRTDAGVHALRQHVHFDTNTSIPAERIPFALNTILPNDIKVLEGKEVSKTFNARFDVKEKTYIYRFYVSEHEKPILFDFQCHLPIMPDLDKMREACALIEGEHDFKCFQASGGHVKTTVRTIYSLSVEQKDKEFTMKVCGNGFLYNMVRIIAGTIYYVGIGKIPLENIPEAFKTGDRTLLGKTLDAKGLYLADVKY